MSKIVKESVKKVLKISMDARILPVQYFVRLLELKWSYVKLGEHQLSHLNHYCSLNRW